MKICPNCKTKMSDTYTHCSVCGCDLSGAYMMNSAVYNQHKRQNQIQKTVLTIVVVVAVIAAVIAGVTFLSYKTNNDVRLLYKTAHSAMYDSDFMSLSEDTKAIIEKASKKASSPFVSKSTREKVKSLESVVKECELLDELENKLLSNKLTITDFNELEDKLRDINESDIKRSERYASVKKSIETESFKYKNKTWADNTLNDMKNGSETINSWGGNYQIKYYAGSPSFVEGDEECVNILLEDYNGDLHDLYMYYNYNESNTWDSSISKLRKVIEAEIPCVMAVAVAQDYYSERIISFNYITN